MLYLKYLSITQSYFKSAHVYLFLNHAKSLTNTTPPNYLANWLKAEIMKKLKSKTTFSFHKTTNSDNLCVNVELILTILTDKLFVMLLTA